MDGAGADLVVKGQVLVNETSLFDVVGQRATLLQRISLERTAVVLVGRAAQGEHGLLLAHGLGLGRQRLGDEAVLQYRGGV